MKSIHRAGRHVAVVDDEHAELLVEGEKTSMVWWYDWISHVVAEERLANSTNWCERKLVFLLLVFLEGAPVRAGTILPAR